MEEDGNPERKRQGKNAHERERWLGRSSVNVFLNWNPGKRKRGGHKKVG